MEVEVKRGNIEDAISRLGKWFQKNLKVELKMHEGFESKGEKRKRKQRLNRRRCKRRMVREAQRDQGR
jgi:ribosomal protein S21